jgi:hypothetical protein
MPCFLSHRMEGTPVDDKVGRPKVGKPGHWRRVGPISDRKQTKLLWVRPEQWDYERYAPEAR